MAIGIITGLLFLIGIAAAFFGACWCYDNDKNVASGILGAVGVILIIAFIIVPFSFHTVETGELAVVKNMGRITHVRDAH